MSDSQEQPWSDDPYAPAIPDYIYRFEKTWFAGVLISSVLYGTPKRPIPIHPSIRAHCSFIWFITGVLVVLFFGCMTTLFNPIHRRTRRIKWGLASYTAIMFSLATVYMAANAYTISISYVDNRNFPGGPYVYQNAIAYDAISIVPRAAFRLNNWSADGLLVGPLFCASVAT